MKHKVSILTILLMVLAIPQNVMAYDFSAVAPSGQTLYYNIVGGNAQVTYQNSFSPSYSSLSGNLVIPATITYNGTSYTVTSIGDSAFYACSGLTSVSIPNSITNIDDLAFAYCRGLSSFTIPSSVTNIGYDAFFYCSDLTSLTIPNSVTSIGNYAFACSGLTAITIGSSVTSIGNRAFSACSALTTVNFNATNCTTMGTINYPVFYNCANLTTLNIGNNVTQIPDYAFNGCNGLTTPNTYR